jgi:Trk-type K+ transport system membrane component
MIDFTLIFGMIIGSFLAFAIIFNLFKWGYNKEQKELEKENETFNTKER